MFPTVDGFRGHTYTAAAISNLQGWRIASDLAYFEFVVLARILGGWIFVQIGLWNGGRILEHSRTLGIRSWIVGYGRFICRIYE